MSIIQVHTSIFFVFKNDKGQFLNIVNEYGTYHLNCVEKIASASKYYGEDHYTKEDVLNNCIEPGSRERINLKVWKLYKINHEQIYYFLKK